MAYPHKFAQHPQTTFFSGLNVPDPMSGQPNNVFLINAWHGVFAGGRSPMHDAKPDLTTRNVS